MRQRKPPDWLIQERRDTLGHWAAFCVECGYTQRYFEELESDLPRECPHCGGEVRSRCPSCHARVPSAFAVDCDACGQPLRPRELFGIDIRRAEAN
jgi:predicted nucleic acid-binding Zn ribbon protein